MKRKSAKFERCVKYVKKKGRGVNPWAVCNAALKGRKRSSRDPILTDEHGRPIDKPRRSDFTSDIAFMHALHAYNDRLTGIGNRAFTEQFRKSMRSKKRRDPSRGTRKQDAKYGDWSGIRKSMTYGQLPSEESFTQAFEEEVPKGLYHVGNDPILGTDSFKDYELWKVLEELTERFHDGDDEAGDTASSILYTLGFEWI